MEKIVEKFSEAINSHKKLELELSPPPKTITIEPHLIAIDMSTGGLICRAWVFYDDQQFWQNFNIEDVKVQKITNESFTIRKGFRDEIPENIKLISTVE